MTLSTPNRVLITGRLYGPGGAETHLLNLCRMLVEQGAEVTLATRFARPNAPLIQLSGKIPIRLVTTPFSGDLRWFRLSTLWAFLFWPRQLRHSHFHVLYTLEVSRFTLFLSRFVRPSGYVIANRFGEPFKKSESLDWRVRKVLDGFIVETTLQAQALRQVYPKDFPVAVIPHIGYFFPPPVRQPRMVNELRVAFLGRYDRLKGIYRLLDVWPDLKIRPARLDFYGHGLERRALEQEIRRRGLAGQVRVNGGWSSGEELGAVLKKIDLVVLPSESEGLPLVLLEAMAHGVPFVATDVGAVRTLAEDNPDVRVVPLDNEVLKQAVEEMAGKIRLGEIRGERLQEFHRRRYSHEYISQRWVDSLLNAEQFWSRLCAMDRQRADLSSEGSARART